MMLRAEEARVLGSLVEKELTTPDQYPLTIKSVLAACNQASNRDPVVDFDESTVVETLDSLKAQRLVRFVLPSHGRSVVRYRHVLDEALGLDTRQCAVLAVLLLRGPQTVGELRTRTERMTDFDGLAAVEHELQFLSSAAEPLAVSLGRRPGQKEERWACPLVAAAPTTESPPPGAFGEPGADSVDKVGSIGVQERRDPLEDLRSEVAVLRAEVGGLRRDLDALRTSLGE
jgi:uncharacterized protein YceH (UPF0502 family)